MANTISTIIGHVSSSTLMRVYAHVTDEMHRTAAVKIDHRSSGGYNGTKKACSQQLPNTQGTAPQTRYRVRLTDQ